MAVNPNEVVIYEKGGVVAGTLIGLAEMQGFTTHHVRSQEFGFAVPRSVADAYNRVPESAAPARSRSEKQSEAMKAAWRRRKAAAQAEKEDDNG